MRRCAEGAGRALLRPARRLPPQDRAAAVHGPTGPGRRLPLSSGLRDRDDGAQPLFPVPLPPLPFRLPRRRLGRLCGLFGALLSGAAIAGCSLQAELPQVLYIAVGTSPDQVINGQLHEEFRERLHQLEQGFRQLHPRTSFRFSLYPETKLLEAMRRRQWAGLEPDLLFVTGRTAHLLVAAGVTRPFPLTPELESRFDPGMARLVSLDDGRLTGLPTLQQVAVSCFDRQRLPEAPATVEALLKASAAGVPIGLSLNSESLFWTVGSLDALPAMLRVIEGGPVTAADRASITGWLRWLADASSQQRVTFYGDQEQAEKQLQQGKLAWIPCRSSTLPRLIKAMGSRLGVAPLPDGARSSASPVNHIRVLALGSNSTRRARAAAIAFGSFTVNPLVQRALTVGTFTVLPVNRHVSIPVSSSQTLAALVRAREQGDQTNQLRRMLHPLDPRPQQMQALVTDLVFGEVAPEAAGDRLIQILQRKR